MWTSWIRGKIQTVAGGGGATGIFIDFMQEFWQKLQNRVDAALLSMHLSHGKSWRRPWVFWKFALTEICDFLVLCGNLILTLSVPKLFFCASSICAQKVTLWVCLQEIRSVGNATLPWSHSSSYILVLLPAQQHDRSNCQSCVRKKALG